MVVKVKRKSINSSGVWEVDETTLSNETKSTKLTPKPGQGKSITIPKPGKGKQGMSPKTGNQNTGSPPKSAIQQPESSSEKPNQTFSPLKRQGERINDASLPAKQTKESEPRSQMESYQTHRPYTNTNTFCTWTAGELLNLVVNVEENCQHLLEEPYTSAVKKVDWGKVCWCACEFNF
ncbi:Protein of unknown function [Gryllus bimaculatus]|nr:Protein of unknown function [Gryllus bimaculatus]